MIPLKIVKYTDNYNYTTHSTYRGEISFQAGPMQTFDRVLTSVDPMHFIAYSSIIGEPPQKRVAKALKHTKKLPFFCPSCKIVFLFGLLQTIQINIETSLAAAVKPFLLLKLKPGAEDLD